MSDISEVEEGHQHRHKFVQHDFDPVDDDPTFVNEEDFDAVWAEAMTPVEYVMSSEEAMASAIDQSRHDV